MTLLNDLEIIWFMAFVVLVTGYVILDGFDLGVGMLHLFAKKDEDRRIMLNAIGPVWDGNEVWLVTAGGALFAGFPDVYSTLCSAFYVPVMILLTGIIFRAIAIEVRSKQQAALWRWTWDILFSFASFVIALTMGLAVGVLITGIPLNEGREFIGDVTHMLNPYTLLIGALAVSLFYMHGAIFLTMKTEGVLQRRLKAQIRPSIIFFILCFTVATMATLIYQPHMVEVFKERPYFFLVALLDVIVIANIPRELSKGREGIAFICSAINIMLLMLLYGIGTFPNLIRATNDPAHLSLTVWNAASSEKTLGILLLIATIGIPIVISYTIAVYWIFRGKVKLDSTSY